MRIRKHKLLSFIMALIMMLSVVALVNKNVYALPDGYNDHHTTKEIGSCTIDSDGILYINGTKDFPYYAINVTYASNGSRFLYKYFDLTETSNRNIRYDLKEEMKKSGIGSEDFNVEVYGYYFQTIYSNQTPRRLTCFSIPKNISYHYNNPNPKLATPKNFKTDTYTLMWDAVPNAVSYDVEMYNYVNNTKIREFTVANNYVFIYNNLYVTGTYRYGFKVYAKAYGYPASDCGKANFYITKFNVPPKIRFNSNLPTSNEVIATKETDHLGVLSELPTISNPGYTFLGWYDAKEGGTLITTDTVFHSEKDVYAHWSLKQHRLDVSSGTATTSAGVTSKAVYAGYGEKVSIKASTAFVADFDHWEVVSGDAVIANKNAEETTVTMGEKDSNVKACYAYNGSEMTSVATYVTEPAAGQNPEAASVNIDACQVSKTSWTDVATGKELSETDVFEAGKEYDVMIVVIPVDTSCVFANGDDAVTGYINDSNEGITINGSPFIRIIHKTFVASYPKCTVKYDANGGSGTIPDEVVDNGAKIVLPANGFTAPEGKVFDKWSVGTPGSEYKVTADTVIKAQWKDKPAEAVIPEDVTYYTVAFNTSGGSEVNSQTIEKGCFAVRPEDPTFDNHLFAGWYADSEMKTPYDFNTPVNSDITIYAGWFSNDFTERPKNEFAETSDGKIYFKEDGTLAKDEWVKVNNIYYYINKDGYTASNEWVDGWWINEDGSCTYDGQLTWKCNSTGWWVEDSKGWYPVSTWEKIDGIWYYFNSVGYMASNEYYNGYWFNSDGSWNEAYYLMWKCNDTGWWVEDKSGWWPSSSWLKIDGYWYYFDGNGYMVSNQYVDGYWLGADGACQ